MCFYNPFDDCQIANLGEIYLDIFGKKSNGVFIEIGAFDGSSMSNTAFLADIGWEGYYFEPVQENAIKCQIRHINNNVKTIPCAVSNKDHNLIFSLGGMLTSARKDHVERFNELGWKENSGDERYRLIPAMSINSILDVLPIINCDLVVIDVEGFEPVIIEKWDFSIIKPQLFIIESRDDDENFSSEIRDEYRNMLQILLDNGYFIRHRDGCNVLIQLNSEEITSI